MPGGGPGISPQRTAISPRWTWHQPAVDCYSATRHPARALDDGRIDDHGEFWVLQPPKLSVIMKWDRRNHELAAGTGWDSARDGLAPGMVGLGWACAGLGWACAGWACAGLGALHDGLGPGWAGPAPGWGWACAGWACAGLGALQDGLGARDGPSTRDGPTPGVAWNRDGLGLRPGMSWRREGLRCAALGAPRDGWACAALGAWAGWTPGRASLALAARRAWRSRTCGWLPGSCG